MLCPSWTTRAGYVPLLGPGVLIDDGVFVQEHSKDEVRCHGKSVWDTAHRNKDSRKLRSPCSECQVTPSWPMALSSPLAGNCPRPGDGKADPTAETGIPGPPLPSDVPRPPTTAAAGVCIGTWPWGCLHGPCQSRSCVPVGPMPGGPGLLRFLIPQASHFSSVSAEFIQN